MEPELTDKQQWLCVELPCGTYYIPADLINLELIKALIGVTGNEALPKELKLLALQKLDDEVKGRLPGHDVIYSVEVIKGYGVRKGGMNWQVYTNKRDAELGLKDMALVGEL